MNSFERKCRNTLTLHGPLRVVFAQLTAMPANSFDTLGIAEFSMPSVSSPADRTREVVELCEALHSVVERPNSPGQSRSETQAIKLALNPCAPTGPARQRLASWMG